MTDWLVIIDGNGWRLKAEAYELVTVGDGENRMVRVNFFNRNAEAPAPITDVASFTGRFAHVMRGDVIIPPEESPPAPRPSRIVSPAGPKSH